MTYQTPQDPFNSHGAHVVPPKRRRPRVLLVALLAVGLAASIITLAAVVPKLIAQRASVQPAGNSPSAKSAEVQVECATVKHEYVGWKQTDTDFRLLVSSTTRVVADMRMKSVAESGEAFRKAASGYQDQPSKALALSIAQHNYDLSVINVELVATNVINVENYDKARKSRTDVEKKYESFLVLTCA